MSFNLEYYRAFFCAANYLSITKAAEQLCITQSAVSQSILKLEKELECKLFIRSPHGLIFTKEGELLYLSVKKAFEELQQAERAIKKMKNSNSGELKIGATETALYLLNGPVPNRFLSQYPGVHISFVCDTTVHTCQKLQEGEIEIAFLTSPVPEEYSFELVKIADIQDVFAAVDFFRIDFQVKHTASEIVEYPMISISSENSTRKWIDKWFLRQGIFFQPDYSVKSMAQTLPLVSDGLGITILPSTLVSNNSRDLRLHRIKMVEELPMRELYLAMNPDIPTSRIVQAFIDIAQNT